MKTWLEITNHTSTFPRFLWILRVQLLEVFIYVNKAVLLIFSWKKYTSNKIWFYLLTELINNYLIFLFCFSQGITNMPQVTVSTVSANNLLPVHLLAYTSACTCIHLLHIIAWVIPQCKTCRSAKKSTSSQGLCLSGSVRGQQSVYQSGEPSWLWKNFEDFYKSFDFPDVEYLFLE